MVSRRGSLQGSYDASGKIVMIKSHDEDLKKWADEGPEGVRRDYDGRSDKIEFRHVLNLFNVKCTAIDIHGNKPAGNGKMKKGNYFS